MHLVSASTPDLVAQYTLRPGLPTCAMIDVILMMRPHLLAFMCGMNARDSRNTPVRLVSVTSLHSSIEKSAKSLRIAVPALLIRI